MITSIAPAEAGVSPRTKTTSRWGGKVGQRVYVGMLILAGLIVAGSIAVLTSPPFRE